MAILKIATLAWYLPRRSIGTFPFLFIHGRSGPVDSDLRRRSGNNPHPPAVKIWGSVSKTFLIDQGVSRQPCRLLERALTKIRLLLPLILRMKHLTPAVRFVTYRDRLKSRQILQSRIQAGPGGKVKQEQEESSRNRLPYFSRSLYSCTYNSVGHFNFDW